MWYSNLQDAKKACIWKEEVYKQPFVVLEENNPKLGIIYWAQRKSIYTPEQLEKFSPGYFEER